MAGKNSIRTDPGTETRPLGIMVINIKDLNKNLFEKSCKTDYYSYLCARIQNNV